MTKAERLKMIVNELSRDLEQITDNKQAQMLVIMVIDRLTNVINKPDQDYLN